MSRPYSVTYKQICESIESYAHIKLGRDLSAKERSGIWNAGSLVKLESVELMVIAARSADDLGRELANLAVAGEQQKQRALDSLAKKLSSLLNRTLTHPEYQRLQQLETLYEAMKLIEQLNSAPPQEREGIFLALLEQISAQQYQ